MENNRTLTGCFEAIRSAINGNMHDLAACVNSDSCNGYAYKVMKDHDTKLISHLRELDKIQATLCEEQES